MDSTNAVRMTYLKVYDSLLRATDISPIDKLLLSEYLYLSNLSKEIKVPIVKIAAMLGVSVSTIQRSMNVLREKGYISTLEITVGGRSLTPIVTVITDKVISDFDLNATQQGLHPCAVAGLTPVSPTAIDSEKNKSDLDSSRINCILRKRRDKANERRELKNKKEKTIKN